MTEISAQTVWLNAPGEIEFRTEALGAPGPEELLCETLFTAISPGTELAAWRGDPPLRPGNPYPRLQGYCSLARVIEAGSARVDIAPGDLIFSLQSHRSHFIIGPKDIACRIHDSADGIEGAASAYLFHLGYNAVLRSDVRAGHTVAVIGLGALGLTSVAMASLAGANVYAITDHAVPGEIARQYGARDVIPRSDAKTATELSPPDVVILTTNSWEDMALAQAIARQNACIACLGFPGRNAAPGDYNPLAAEYFYNKQLRIEAVGAAPLENDPRNFSRFNVRENLGYILSLMETGRLNPTPILSGRYAATALGQAYTDLEARKDNAITYLLDWAQ